MFTVLCSYRMREKEMKMSMNTGGAGAGVGREGGMVAVTGRTWAASTRAAATASSGTPCRGGRAPGT
jgi:hypothetical protein